MSTEWLQSIRDHPIFRDLHSSHATTSRPDRSVLAVHESEIFLASNDTVRYADINKGQDYIELDIPLVEFPICSLLLNKSRSLLVVVGTKNVVVSFLPRVPSQMGRRLKSHVVGGSNHGSTTIRQVTIHPYCSSDSALVILTQDSYLRLYDLTLSFEKPETTIDILPPDLRRSISRHFLGDAAEVESSSFSFGKGGDGWSTFSVFVLMRNGDVYVVCPVLPANCHISSSDLEPFETHAATEAGSPSVVAYSRLLQAIDRGTRTSSGIAFARPARLLDPVVLGPILFSPAPLEFTNSDSEASSICFLPLQPLNVLAIASSEKVDICVLAEPIMPSLQKGLTVSVHESISLPGLTGIRIKTLDTEDDTTTYICHNDGIFEIRMKQWVEEIRAAFESDDPSSVVEAASDSLPSQVVNMLDCRGSAIIGYDIVQDDLQKAILAVRDSYDVHAFPLSLGSITSKLESLLSESDSDVGEAQEIPSQAPRYHSLLSAPAYKPPQIPKGPQIVVPNGIANKHVKPDVDTLEFLAKFATQHRNSMQSLMGAFVSMHRRLALQQKEYERQKAKVKALAKSVSDSSPSASGRLERVQNLQSDLESRCAKLVQDLMNNHSPKLSDSEKRYFEELKRIEKHVLGQRGLLKRLESATTQMDALKTSLPSADQVENRFDSTPANSPLRTKEVGKIRSQIDYNEEIMGKAKTRLERLIRLNKATLSSD